MTFSNKYNFDAGLSNLFTYYRILKEKMFPSTFSEATVTGASMY
jgi:hypothetical protein